MPLRQAFSTLFALGYAEMPVRPVGPAWSLDIEMQFYLVAPALVWLVRRTSAVVALAGAYALYVAGMVIYPGIVLTSFVPFFVIGMVAAQHRWSVPPRLAETALALAIVLTAGILLSPWHASMLGEGGAHWPQVNLLLAALALPQALVSVQNKGGKRDAVWADQSYIVYMLHWPAILVWRAVAWPNPIAMMAGLLGLAAAVALMAWLLRRAFDRPLNRARARWVEQRRNPGADLCASADDAKGDDRPPVFA
jgi:peptidoglycan/LPS O-acetylase OafA/YrhL